MEQFGGLIAAALVLTAVTLLLKNQRPEYAMLVSIGCVALFMGRTLLQMIPLFTTISELAGQAGVESGYIRLMLRCLGICLLSEIGVSLCREAGQQSAAVQIELAGKVLILSICMPVYQKLLELALSLIG
jgi:stage III sporulation protein AD